MSNAYKRASLVLQKATGPKWKQELVSDHKFDFIDIEDFRDYNCILAIRYILLLCSVVVSVMVYGADLWSAAILLIYDKWSLSTQPKIPFYISKWIYVGCIALSFMLLAWEIRKTRNVMETRDISLAVTNPLAYRTYSTRSYIHFCLLRKIKSSTRWSDVVIFYVFYTLKGWKRVIVAQGPRQIIAGITVYALLKSAWTDANGGFKFSDDWDTYGKDWPQRVALVLMCFTCILWILSALSILLAVLLYFPILCQIQGNLKEYCCHKIDKRCGFLFSIDELLEKQRKKRLRENERKYANSISSKKSKRHKKDGDQVIEVLPALPTLPKINNVDLYAGEKKNSPWLYRHHEQQDSFYYDSQPMTPLESSYSLQRNPTNKYNPYNEAPRIQYQNSVHQPAKAYTQQLGTTTTNYYYSQQAQHSDHSTVYNTPSTEPSYNHLGSHDASTTTTNKPHEYDDYSSVAGHSQQSQSKNTHMTHGGYSQASNDNYGLAAKSPSYHHQQQNASHYQQSYEDLSATTQQQGNASSSYDDYFQSAVPQATTKQQTYAHYI
ncbi:vacuole protein [Mucor ambiguus]|uniref:Vacuole protein n=1 Tax=Mucor ambiguus TaxID=91626 RepID=A0A0C9M0B0_9FUNG|nr:vacuole protein [Mucor ambiguus]